jgi:surfactin synthase thioesterase subunit
MRLVTFAHAGGGPRTYTRWERELAPAIELWHVALPGRGRRRHEPFARDWDTLARDLATAVARDVPAPFALFGHSLGALVAFEVARLLTCAGTSPAHLVVSGRDAPDSASDLELPETDDDLLRYVDRAYGRVPDEVRASRDVA